MKFEKYLNEARGTDAGKEVRELIKKKFGLTSRDVSVRNSRGTALDITLKTVKALPYINKIKEIGSGHESYQRDERTGDILRGGNFFVFTNLDWKFRDRLVKQIESEISKKITDEFMNGEGGGNTIKVFGMDVVKSRQSQNDEFWVSHPKTHSAGPVSRDIMGVSSRVLELMLKYEDTKNLKKLK